MFCPAFRLLRRSETNNARTGTGIVAARHTYVHRPVKWQYFANPRVANPGVGFLLLRAWAASVSSNWACRPNVGCSMRSIHRLAATGSPRPAVRFSPVRAVSQTPRVAGSQTACLAAPSMRFSTRRRRGCTCDERELPYAPQAFGDGGDGYGCGPPYAAACSR